VLHFPFTGQTIPIGGPANDDMGAATDIVTETFGGGTTVVSSTRVTRLDEATTELLERIGNLPNDLRGELDAWARKEGIPNLTTAGDRGPSPEQLDQVRAKVGELVAHLCARVDDLHRVVGPDLVPAIAGRVLIGPFRGEATLTRDECEAIKALFVAYERGWVGSGIDSEGRTTFDVTDSKALTTAINRTHGSAAAAKLACARWALALGRPREFKLPTVKAMSQHPIIGPVMALGPAYRAPESTNPTQESE
jgi:hypothetical protein